MITPGATVTHAAFGSTAWVVKRVRTDGLVDIVSKATTIIGGVVYQGLPASPGDLTEVEPAPVLSPGAVLTRDGIEHTVLEDLGDDGVLFEVGEHFQSLKAGGRVRFEAGDTTMISKFDLVLENLV